MVGCDANRTFKSAPTAARALSVDRSTAATRSSSRNGSEHDENECDEHVSAAAGARPHSWLVRSHDRALARRRGGAQLPPDDSELARLPSDVIELSLSYLPLRFLSNTVKTTSRRYRELALPLLVARMIWLERELSHDVFTLASAREFRERRPFYEQLEQICRTLGCTTYIERPDPLLLVPS